MTKNTLNLLKIAKLVKPKCIRLIWLKAVLRNVTFKSFFLLCCFLCKVMLHFHTILSEALSSTTEVLCLTHRPSNCPEHPNTFKCIKNISEHLINCKALRC